jgi:hypothetical protein
MIREKTNKIIQRAVLLASGSFVVWFILNLKWSRMLFFPSDVSFFLAPFLVFFILLFVASVVSILISNPLRKRVASKTLRGLAFSILLFQIYKWAPVPGFVQVTFLPVSLTLWVIVTSTIAVESPKIQKYRELLLPTVSANMLASSIYYVALLLSKENSSIINSVLPFVGGLVSVGLGALIGFLKYTGIPRTQMVAERISDEPGRNFLAGFLFSLYIFFFRPSVIASLPSWIAVEWFLISSAVAAMYFNIARLSNDLYANVTFEKRWRKHIQKIERETGKDFSDLLNVQKMFVNQNVKEPLLVFMTFYLNYLGQPDSILAALTPLIYYREVKSPLAFLPWVKRRIEKKNKDS